MSPLPGMENPEEMNVMPHQMDLAASLVSQGGGPMSQQVSPEEERMLKRKRRLVQNRKSAALSRSRKKDYLGNLEKQNAELKLENEKWQARVAQITNQEWEFKTRLEEQEMLIKHLKEENDILKQKLGIPLDSHDDMSTAQEVVAK